MDKMSDPYTSHKKPWIPPPGKASKVQKAIPESMISKDVQSYHFKTRLPYSLPNAGDRNSIALSSKDILKEDIETAMLQSAEPSGDMLLCSQTPTIVFSDLHRNTFNSRPNFSQKAIQNFSNEIKIEDIYLGLQKLKENSSEVQSIRDSFKSVLDVLHRPLFISVTDDLTVNQMISQCDCLVNEFFSLYIELDNHIASSDLISRHDTVKLLQHLNASQTCQENLRAKLLQAYDSITSCLKFIVEVMQQEHFSTLYKNQESLKKRVEFLQNSFLDREGKIKHLENELRLSLEKIHILEEQKNTFETVHKPFKGRWNSEVNNLHTELHAYKHDLRLIAENASILKIYSDAKKDAESEIVALKKALVIRKSALDHYQSTSNQLRETLNEKEQELLKLGLERDHWKSALTNSNNKLVEAESQIKSFELKNAELLKEVNNLKEHNATLSKMESTVHEKSLLLDSVTNEKTRLNEAILNAEEKFSASQNEIKLLQQKYANLEEKLESQINCAKNEKMDSENTHLIIPLLQELKNTLTALRENGLQSSNNHCQPKDEKLLEENLLGLVKEIKNLIESKEVHQDSLEQNIANQRIASVEDRFCVLREKCDREIAEKERRLEQLQEQITSANAKYSSLKNFSFNADSNLLNFESVDKTKLASLEEELKRKNLELASMKRQQLESKNRFENEIRDLKSNLNRITVNYDSLQRYVNMLKSSYTNVFGSS